jgi:predicted alpha/beta superfamily hydrolase
MMQRIIGSLAVTLLLCFGSAATAQQHTEPIVAGTRTVIESTVLGESRPVWISTPPSYESSDERYPVLYLLDGDVHFHHAIGLVRYLAYYLRAPEMIVVAVLNTNRTRDFTPSASDGNVDPSSRTGGAARFHQFLTAELKPYVEREYRTGPFSILIGHSLAGLFTVYSLVNAPEAFGAHIAISPSLYWGNPTMGQSAQRTLGPGADRSGYLYLALGEVERSDIVTSTRSLATALQNAAPERLRWKFDEFAGEHHLTVPYPALHAALRFVFDGWSLPSGTVDRIASQRSINAFEEHYRGLTARYGFEVRPTELIISLVGDRLYQDGNLSEAIDLFQLRVRLYPDSPEAHDELGRGLEAVGNHALAHASFERAYELAVAQRHPSLEAIRERLERSRARQ